MDCGFVRVQSDNLPAVTAQMVAEYFATNDCFNLTETRGAKILRFKMGQHFGELAKIYGIITYKLSPMEQRAFAGAISQGVPNIFRRVGSNILRVVPPFVIGYLVYDWANKEHARLMRKNPADFANDE